MERNKERNHFPKRIPDAECEWKEVKAGLKRDYYQTQQVQGNHKKGQAKTASNPKKTSKKTNTLVPSDPPRKSSRRQGKKGK